MSATLLQLVYVALAAVGAALWGVALFRGAARVDRRGARMATLLVAAALVVLGLRWASALALHALDAAFAQEKLLVGLPLSTVASLSAALLSWLPRPAAGSSRVRAFWLTAAVAASAYSAGAEVLLSQVIGAPVGLWAAVAVVAGVIGSAAATAMAVTRRDGTTRRPLAAVSAATVAVVVGAAAFGWIGATGPGALSAAGFQDHAGHSDTGGEASGDDEGDAAGGGAGDATSVVALTGDPVPVGAHRVRADLTAQHESVTLPSGRTAKAWTFGELGGPAIEATVGDVIDVRLANRDIEEGVTVHWHGYPVPNAMDGVAGVTQDSLRPGEEVDFSFAVSQPGTYWYHTHQRGSQGVVRGLYGTLVVQPATGPTEDVDVVLPVHTLSGRVLLGGSDVLESRLVAAGDSVRVRLVNTDQVPQIFAVQGAPFTVAAIDGTEVTSTPMSDRAVAIPAGGRVDVVFPMGADPVRVGAAASRGAGLLFTTAPAQTTDAAPLVIPTARFDPLHDLLTPPGAATPERAAAGAALEAALASRSAGGAGFDVERTYVLDRLPRIVGGLPAYGYTVDADVYPYIAPTVVHEGDTVLLRVVNRSFETHPMHPHGHAVRVLSVDGVAPEQPLWLDTFDVGPGEVWEVALLADNPGIWMDHCHNLEHASLGMVTHLAYAGVVSPFEHGGEHDNAPE